MVVSVSDKAATYYIYSVEVLRDGEWVVERRYFYGDPGSLNSNLADCHGRRNCIFIGTTDSPPWLRK